MYGADQLATPMSMPSPSSSPTQLIVAGIVSVALVLVAALIFALPPLQDHDAVATALLGAVVGYWLNPVITRVH